MTEYKDTEYRTSEEVSDLTADEIAAAAEKLDVEGEDVPAPDESDYVGPSKPIVPGEIVIETEDGGETGTLGEGLTSTVEGTGLVVDRSNLVSTGIQTGVRDTILCCEGTVSNGTSTMVYETTFNAKSGFCYTKIPTITMHGLSSGGYNYYNYYNTKVIPTYANGRIISFKAQVFYDPPQDRFLYPDPSEFFSFNHGAVIDYELREIEQTPTRTVTHISYPSSLTRFDQEAVITVYGTVGAKYIIKVTKQTDTTSDIPAESGYYDFKEKTFTTFNTNSNHVGTIGKNKIQNHFIKIPNVSSKTRYDIVLAGVDGFTLQPKVPTKHGDTSITQYSLNTLTLTPVTYGSNVTAPSGMDIKTPANVPGVNLGGSDPQTIIMKGGNNNSSSTEVTLDSESTQIKKGMYVLNLGTNTHGITVSSFDKNILTLSSAAAVPDDTSIRFEKETSNIISFDFTVTPTDGKTIYLEQQPTISDIAGFGNINVLTNGVVSSSANVKVDSTAGIVPGMIVTAKDTPGLSTQEINVSSITDTDDLVLSVPVTLKDNTRLVFTGGNKAVEVLDIQAQITDGAVRVKGMLKVNRIDEVYIDGTLQSSSIAYIYLDNFITAN